MTIQNTHPKAVALREAAQAFAVHIADEVEDDDDKKGQRLNAALLSAARDYARAVDPDFHACTRCDRPVAPRFTGNHTWCSCRPKGPGL